MTDYHAFDISHAMGMLSPQTQKLYRRFIRRFVGYLCQVDADSVDVHALDLERIAAGATYSAVATWLGLLKTKNPLWGASSFQTARQAVNWLVRLLAALELVDPLLPMRLRDIPLPRAERGQNPGTWLSQDEVMQLLAFVQCKLHTNASMRSRDLVIIGLMVLCGLRRGEVSSVVWSDVFTEHGLTFLRVHGKGNKLRIVKLSDLLVTWIDEWRALSPQTEPHGPMFFDLNHQPKNALYKPLGAEYITQMVNNAAVRANLPPLSPHDLRRSFSRTAYENGAPFELIRQTLGHAHVQMTEHYVNNRVQLDRTATDILAEWLEEGDDDA